MHGIFAPFKTWQTPSARNNVQLSFARNLPASTLMWQPLARPDCPKRVTSGNLERDTPSSLMVKPPRNHAYMGLASQSVPSLYNCRTLLPRPSWLSAFPSWRTDTSPWFLSTPQHWLQQTKTKLHFTSSLTTPTRVSTNDKLVVLGDFNARVGKDHHLWEEVIGHHGIRNCNANGQFLLGLCAEHQLIVTNTIFRLTNRQKTTWRHPRSKHWHILDYILTRARDRRYVRITQTMTGADDCWTDHRLLISRLTVTTLRPPQKTPDSVSHWRFDCSKLRDPQQAQNFREACERHLAEHVDQTIV